jgi:hypothetical protein
MVLQKEPYNGIPKTKGKKWRNKNRNVYLKDVHNGLLQDKKWTLQQNIFHSHNNDTLLVTEETDCYLETVLW